MHDAEQSLSSVDKERQQRSRMLSPALCRDSSCLGAADGSSGEGGGVRVEGGGVREGDMGHRQVQAASAPPAESRRSGKQGGRG